MTAEAVLRDLLDLKPLETVSYPGGVRSVGFGYVAFTNVQWEYLRLKAKAALADQHFSKRDGER